MRVLIVDGHSMIFAWSELRKLHSRRAVAAREELVKTLTGYQDSTGTHVVVVFDGRGTKMSEDTMPGGIQVFYSASGRTADSIIERLVAKYAREHDITVATDDSLEQQTAITFGARVISSELLRSEVAEASADLGKRLKSLKKDRLR